MPQLDVTTFSSQLFWLVVCFLALYVLLSTFLLPKIVRVLGNRDAVREEKINKASLYREEAEGLLMDYEKAIEQARKDAVQNYHAYAHETVTEIAQKKAEMLDKHQERLRVAEINLQRARLEAATEMHTVAQDIAGEILEKLTGQTYSVDELKDTLR